MVQDVSRNLYDSYVLTTNGNVSVKLIARRSKGSFPGYIAFLVQRTCHCFNSDVISRVEILKTDGFFVEIFRLQEGIFVLKKRRY